MTRHAASSSPVVTLSYVDPGYASIAGFANHLNAYGPLFRATDEFRFLFISNSAVHFRDAERCFSSRCKSTDFDEILRRDLLRYFRLRKAWDLKKYALFSNNEIEWLNDATRRFQRRRVSTLFTRLGARDNSQTMMCADSFHRPLLTERRTFKRSSSEAIAARMVLRGRR